MIWVASAPHHEGWGSVLGSGFAVRDPTGVLGTNLDLAGFSVSGNV